MANLSTAWSAHIPDAANDEKVAAGLPAVALTEPAPIATIPTVDVAGVFDNPSPPPAFVWSDRVPLGHVCLLSGHGGSGKSTLALQLAAAVAMGQPLLGVSTKRGRVLFFSGEDAEPLLRHRLAAVCQSLDVNPHKLAEQMRVLDGTEEPALYREVAEFGTRRLEPTPIFDRLAELVNEWQPALVVIDNASDTFEGSENDRAQVRAFVRGLARLARETATSPAILLLTHTPKASIGGRGESYSGSTAWHNSSRARLSLTPDKDDPARLVLSLDKINVAPPLQSQPLRLARAAGGVLVLDDEGAHGAEGAQEPPELALLTILADFVERGERVSCEQTAHTNAWKMCRPEPGFPKRSYPNAGVLFAAIRQMERDGLIERESYRDTYRKDRTAWNLTAKGWERIGKSAPSAPSAPSYHENADDAVQPDGAPSAPSSAHRSVRGYLAHDEGAPGTCPRCDGEGCEFCQPKGLTPRQAGTNPRAIGTNPRAIGTNPRRFTRRSRQ
ncbi:AAA family ATPase [Acidithiobacillus sp. VAN18-1]|uniref:AAA family ATPase n=1 Tax=Igneacidithiobacillus copahuensis TaxID=2724909 RepID=A0AAE2YNI9_9PROT|nr:AAA family ATPase [Igneacidithiobacillus copahuensis]MBU2787321.1 AAA family ATPase [Igneacidithiobacillus copahuensis]MBU2797340.1 AAA family ATPase [Acidithiobacillus sp. VAN18-2]